MSYIKQNFEDGQILTAEQLNAMDNQIAQNESDVINNTENLNNMQSLNLLTIFDSYYHKEMYFEHSEDSTSIRPDGLNKNAIRDYNISYNSYWLQAKYNTSVYFTEIPTETYYSITILRNPKNNSWLNDKIEGDSCERYRKSDNNLPTINNPINVNMGDLIFVTIDVNNSAYYYHDGIDTSVFKDNLSLSDYQINQVKKIYRLL